MGLYDALRTGVSGMNAQTAKMGSVADNIANSATTGYKRSAIEFSTLIPNGGGGGYQSGAVETTTRRAISDAGGISYTTSGSDLAISGDGFFIVSDGANTPYLTRAGNFVVDGPSGYLVNAAGFKLMGRPLTEGAGGGLLNSMNDLVPVNLASLSMRATPSTSGTFTGNLPADAAVITSPPPATTEYSKKSSLEVYDNIGNPVKLDIYMLKTGAGEWQAAVYDGGDPAAFPGTPLGTQTLTFDAFGQLSGGSSLSLTVPNGSAFTLDMTGMSELGGAYDVTGTANGNEPTAVKGAEFGADGTVYAVYENGGRVAAFQIPLATVASPDNLAPRAGNVFEATIESGSYQVGTAGAGGFGSVRAGALEGSNVDVGSELTTMVESQTGFTANSKTFQTASEMLDVLINLKR